VVTTNDMLVEEDDKEEESGDFEHIEDKGLKDSKDKDFEIIEEMCVFLAFGSKVGSCEA
jgi:hypothetical protein